MINLTPAVKESAIKRKGFYFLLAFNSPSEVCLLLISFQKITVMAAKVGGWGGERRGKETDGKGKKMLGVLF